MQLGYVGFEVTEVDAWKRLCIDVIGLMDAGENVDGSIGFRTDECVQRLFVRRGLADDLCALGLCAESVEEYETTLSRLAANGVAFETAPAATARARGVARLARVSGPYDVPFELTTPLLAAHAPFLPRFPDEDWLTGKLGVGHVLMLVPDKNVMSQFLLDCFGFRYSNTGKAPWNGVAAAEVDFLNCNARHHSLAPVTVGQRLPKLIGHFMIEKISVDGVGLAYDRVRKAGLHVTNELGRHTDGSLSFYFQTPSGFDFEIAAEGYLVGEDWTVSELSAYSVWGHTYHPAPPPT